MKWNDKSGTRGLHTCCTTRRSQTVKVYCRAGLSPLAARRSCTSRKGPRWIRQLAATRSFFSRNLKYRLNICSILNALFFPRKCVRFRSFFQRLVRLFQTAGFACCKKRRRKGKGKNEGTDSHSALVAMREYVGLFVPLVLENNRKRNAFLQAHYLRGDDFCLFVLDKRHKNMCDNGEQNHSEKRSKKAAPKRQFKFFVEKQFMN